MTHPKTLISLALATGLGLASAAHAGNVEWSVSVGMPVPVQVAVPAPVYAPAPAPVYAPAPIAPTMPNIEHIQAQQQARIQWGSQVGLVTGHEYNRLQQTQGYIEQQRQWAYADGWLTYDEHMNLMNLLNGASQQIERTLANWQRVNTAYYPMPPVLTIWNAPRPQYWHHGHRQNGVAPAPAVVQVAVPVQPFGPRGQRAPIAAPAQPVVQPVVQPTARPPVQMIAQPPQAPVVQPQIQPHHGHRDVQMPDTRPIRY